MYAYGITTCIFGSKAEAAARRGKSDKPFELPGGSAARRHGSIVRCKRFHY